MTLPKPTELRALLKVCREFGVENVEVGELKIKFGDMPRDKEEPQELTGIPGGATVEELTFWSAAPDPLAERMNEGQAS